MRHKLRHRSLLIATGAPGCTPGLDLAPLGWVHPSGPPSPLPVCLMS